LNTNLIPDHEFLYSELYQIRRFEETLLDNYSKGLFAGTTHTYLGQEANAVGVISQLKKSDVIFSNHRGHGHYLAFGGDVRRLFAELMGRATGVCAGRGGSQHLHWENFYSNGIQGGILPVATGMALAEKFKHSGTVVVAFIGDGTLGEGVVYESLNMASLWKIPLLIVLENNRIAQSTPIELAVAGSIAQRFTAFGIPTIELDTSDVLDILLASQDVINQVRSTGTPRAIILHTYRFGPHSKGDDTRPPKEIERYRLQRDPLRIQASRLDERARGSIEEQINMQIDQAFKKALADPFPSLVSVQGQSDLPGRMR
jgi:TPP-dependent pyruvate/acetoin dehydrogenase alpha subunit